ncbi:MAG: citrate transporter [Duodenibacillus sp.]|nr:citrate transporter [Duodenibacillus sp.]
MCVTLALIISGRTPIYLTAIAGASLSALAAGLPLSGGEGSLAGLVAAAVHPVLADMTGILLFIGVMQATGFMDVVVRDLVRLGHRLGGGVGVCTAGSVAAGVTGAFTGITQPVITAIVTGPAAVRLGVDPNKVAAIQGHGVQIGCITGFTHPTQVAIMTTAGIGVGLFNALGFVTAVTIILFTALRAAHEQRKLRGLGEAAQRAALEELLSREYKASSGRAWLPLAVLEAAFAAGVPIFAAGALAASAVAVLARAGWKEAEAMMVEGVAIIAAPLVATLSFLLLANAIRAVGLADALAGLIAPWMQSSPVLVMFAIAVVTGLLMQSYSASIAVVLPFLQATLACGADPFAAAFAAASGVTSVQAFLSGCPVAGLATVIPVIPGSELRAANAYQRPGIVAGAAAALLIVIAVTP